MGHKDLVGEDGVCKRYPGLAAHLDVENRAQLSMPLGYSFTRQITQGKHMAYIWVAGARDRDVLQAQFSLLFVAFASGDQSVGCVQESSSGCNADNRRSFVMFEAFRHLNGLDKLGDVLHTMLICKEKWEKKGEELANFRFKFIKLLHMFLCSTNQVGFLLPQVRSL